MIERNQGRAAAPRPEEWPAPFVTLLAAPGRSNARPTAPAIAWAPALRLSFPQNLGPQANAVALTKPAKSMRTGLRYRVPPAGASGLPGPSRDVRTGADGNALHAATDIPTAESVAACKSPR